MYILEGICKRRTEKRVMKKLIYALGIICLLCFSLGMAGCFFVGGGESGDKKIYLEQIILNVDKQEVKVGETIKLSFSPVPSDANTVKDLNGTEKSYDPRCIEYFFRNGDNNTRLNPNRDISVDYMVKFVGTNVFWAKYCHHSTHNDSSADIISSEVQVVAEGYKITTVEELKAIAGTTKGYELTNDLDLGGTEWESFEFSGSIDGGGYTISNFTLSENKDNLGFFSVLTGTVSNLKFSDVSVELRGSRTNVGIVAADNRGTIELCEVDGQIEAGYASNVGGIAGRNSGTIRGCVNNATVIGGTCTGGIAGLDEKSSLENCKNYGEIQGNGNTGGIVGKTSGDVSESENFGDIFSEDSYTGGVIGYINGTFSSLSNGGDVVGEDYTGGVIGYFGTGSGEDLVSIANVTGNDHVGGFFGVFGYSVTMAGLVNESVVMGRAYVGGIAGEGGNFIDCINNGQIVTEGVLTDNGEAFSYVGGIVGRCGAVTDCSNTADISANGQYIGGVAGYVTGNIDGAVNEGAVSGAERCGGIAGHLEGNISETNNYGDVQGEDYTGGLVGHYRQALEAEVCTNSGEVNGNHYTGGLFGGGETASIIHSAIIIACDNFGSVTGKDYTGSVIGYASAGTVSGVENNVTVTGRAYLGGIAGFFGGTLTDCTNSGEVVSVESVSEGGEQYSYVGGIAGMCGSISGCENISDISAQGSYVGGIAGYVSGTISGTMNDGIVRGGDNTGGISGYVKGDCSDLDNYANVTGEDYTGGISGYLATTADFENCNNYGETKGADYTGGILGYCSGSITLVSCTNEGTVSGGNYSGGFIGYASGGMIEYAINGVRVEGGAYLGGIAGYFGGTLNDCQNTGEIAAQSTLIKDNISYSYLGGLAGYCNTIEGGSNTSTISGGGRYIGGIAGYVNEVISDVEATANVFTTIKNDIAYLGGVVGYAISIIRCRNDININVSANCVGGIAGFANKAHECINFGDITAKDFVGGIFGGCDLSSSYNYDLLSNYNEGNIDGENYVGGIIGGYIISLDTYYSNAYDLDISKNFNVGNVSATGNYVGGIVGKVEHLCEGSGGYFIFSYNENAGTIDGEDYVGGLAGDYRNTLYDATYGTRSGKAEVFMNKNTGNVSGNKNIGGIMGYTKGFNDRYGEFFVHIYENLVDANCSIIGNSNVEQITNFGTNVLFEKS